MYKKKLNISVTHFMEKQKHLKISDTRRYKHSAKKVSKNSVSLLTGPDFLFVDTVKSGQNKRS